ncbi:MAG: GNAT family N-acetyltransferase [Alistipes sp.]|nr:GNAT family N-acetyltransferase [Alistipes sp.]
MMRTLQKDHIYTSDEVPRSDISALRNELIDATYLGRATHCNASIYSFDGARLPMLMREVGRLRRESYAVVGVAMPQHEAVDGADIDGTYRQLIVWDNDAGVIIGGYRYAVGREVAPERLSLCRYFDLSDTFRREVLPEGVELGRSFVHAAYQRSRNSKTIFALDALWEGIARVVERERVGYLFGRVTLYPALGVRARNVLVGFMRHVFPAREPLVVAREPLTVGISRRWLRRYFTAESPRDNYRILLCKMRDMHRAVPPIISSYMRLSPTMQTFEAYRNDDLGGVVECGIMLTIADIYTDLKKRYFRL